MNIVSLSKQQILAVSNRKTLLVSDSNQLQQTGFAEIDSGTPEVHEQDHPANVVSVCATDRCTGAVTQDGRLFMCGRNRYGQLGLGIATHNDVPTLQQVPVNNPIKMVTGGKRHTVALTRSGAVYTFGCDEDSKLGLQHAFDNNVAPTPQRLPDDSFQSVPGHNEKIVMVAAGKKHSFALSRAGFVFSWGYDESGVLGLDQGETNGTPMCIDSNFFSGERITYVATAKHHAVAITTEGSVFTWGCQDTLHAELGRGDLDGDNTSVPGRVDGPWRGKAVTAACGTRHTLVLTSLGEVWGCGEAFEGQLGLGDEIDEQDVFRRIGEDEFGASRVVAVAAGGNRSVAVTEDGTLWVFGREKSAAVPDRVPTRLATDYKVDTVFMRKLAFVMGMHNRLCFRSASPSFVKSLSDDVAMKILMQAFDIDGGP
tara:strand:- start:733 stop:2010 length:1278 start_codon:yes stop_codon:yes gene_type:complete